jgi:hypothetical protein
MKYMRRTAGYIWIDYKTNAQIAKELKITPILDKLLEYLVFLTLKKRGNILQYFEIWPWCGCRFRFSGNLV